jgi:2-methylcitrate dehydratase PrpD
MAIAAGQAAGNFAHLQERGMMKDFNPGRAAANGVLSALLAQKGFTGGTNAFENPRGFGNLYSEAFDPDELTDGLGGPPKILEVAHKPFPGCRHLHSSRDALLSILEEAGEGRSLEPDEVEKVTARIFSTGAAYVDDPIPWAPGKGSYGPNFSAQFNLALVLQEGEEGLRRLFQPGYALEMVQDPRLQKLMGKVEVVHDEELNRDWPRVWASEVTLKTTRDTYTRRVDLPLGEPENPMTDRDLLEKFTILATAHAFSLEQSREIVGAIEKLEESGEASELIRLLSPRQS